MRKQHIVIKTIIKEIIRGCEHGMITRDASPETRRPAGYRFDMAKEAMKSLRTTMKPSQGYREVDHHAKTDRVFAHKIVYRIPSLSLVKLLTLIYEAVDRLARYRIEIWTIAITSVVAYQSGIDIRNYSRLRFQIVWARRVSTEFT